MPLDALPYDVLFHIACEVANTDTLGPPAHLAAFFRTNRRLSLLAHDANLLARVFSARFDTSAVRRRFGHHAAPSRALASQLKLYCVALKHIRTADVHASTLEHDLWVAYVMLTEADTRNHNQLVHYAGLPAFADRLVRTRLREQVLPTGWPQDNAVNSLAVWLLWMTTDLHTLQAESDQDREQLIRLIFPYVICCFRYNAFHAADLHYVLPLDSEAIQQLPLSLATVHGPYPRYPDRHAFATLTLYNRRVKLAPPLLCHAAQLLYFSRRELGGLAIPDHIPRNRAHALSLGHAAGPTRADFEEFNATPGARTLSWGIQDRHADPSLPQEQQQHAIDNGTTQQEPYQSVRFDADWERLSGCYDPWNTPDAGEMFGRYALGSMVGQWVGRMLFPEEVAYRSMMQNPSLPPDFSEWHPHCSVRPFMFNLREYHCNWPEEPVDHVYNTNGLDEGVLNAYLPALQYREEEDYALLTDGNNMEYEYDNFTPGRYSAEDEEDFLPSISRRPKPERDIEAPHDEAGMPQHQMEVDEEEIETETKVNNGSLLDVIFLGETEPRHGDAWCHYKYYGRLRSWDGLIVLVAVPLDMNELVWGKWVFRGYLHGNQNFVGRWHHYGYDVHGPAYEGPFTFSKCSN